MAPTTAWGVPAPEVTLKTPCRRSQVACEQVCTTCRAWAQSQCTIPLETLTVSTCTTWPPSSHRRCKRRGCLGHIHCVLQACGWTCWWQRRTSTIIRLSVIISLHFKRCFFFHQWCDYGFQLKVIKHYFFPQMASNCSLLGLFWKKKHWCHWIDNF